jgi:hypothetical protein
MSNSLTLPVFDSKDILKPHKNDNDFDKIREYYRYVSDKMDDSIGNLDKEPEYTMLHKWSVSYVCIEPEFVLYVHNFTMAHPWTSHKPVDSIKAILEAAPLKITKAGLNMRRNEIKHVAHIYDEEGLKVSSVDKLKISY